MVNFATLSLIVMVIATTKVALISSMDYCYPPIRLQYGGYFPEKTEYPVGHKIEYYCEDGFELQGIAIDECKYDASGEKTAKFTSLPPTCKRKTSKCPELPYPTYGSVSVTGYLPDSTALYKCDDGYKLQGEEYRTCQYDGTWSGSVPSCIPSECPYLNDPSNGHVVVIDRTPGSEAHYECDDGYKLDGVAYRRCLDDCTWSSEAPVCKPIRCPPLPPLKHGRVLDNGNSPGKFAYYVCIGDYKLVGEAFRTCQYTGQWDGEAPTCRLAQCPYLSDPLHGFVKYDNQKRTPRTEAHYECYKGYKRVGVAYRECSYGCRWLDEAPKCIPITCSDHSAPKHGIVKYDGYTPRSRVHYSCNRGYKLEGLAFRECDYLGRWRGELPKCIPSICPKLNIPKYGNIHVVSYTSGSIATYRCGLNYKLEGDNKRICQDDCTWSGKQPRCIPVICPQVGGLKNGKVDYNGYRPGLKLHYECNSGYKLIGLKYRICGVHGKWSGEAPKCIPSRCPELSNIEYGVVSIPSYYPGSRAHYSCIEGYKLIGDPYRTCQDDCKWFGKPPRCIPIKCESLPTLSHGSIHISDYIVGSTAEYKCSYGYRLVGESIRTCQHDEQWSGAAPVCELITCPKLDSPKNGQVYTSSLNVAAEANYICDYGHKLVGDSPRRCKGNGEWSGTAPFCQPSVETY